MAVNVEVMPRYPGGEEDLAAFVRDTGVYPEEAVRDSVEGRVVVTFTVDSLGNVCKPRVVRSVHPLLDAEALRIVGSMPRWIPGTVMGRPVNVRYVIPLHFLLDPARANKKRLLIMPRAKHLGQR